MIPKLIHYCWFGGNPLPDSYQKYVDSWSKFLPDYKIIKWDESNFNVNCIDFTKEAYSIGKYAYVSDYARLKVLYELGGVYFDTDVEVIADMSEIMNAGAWMAVEKHKSYPDLDDMVALGLGFAVEPHNAIVKEVMSFYEKTHYIFPDGHIEQIPIVPITTDVLRKYGLPTKIEQPTIICGITVYPWDYFCPQEFLSSKIEVTKNTVSVHHYASTWMSRSDKFKMWKGKIGNKVKRYLHLFKK